MSYFKLLVFKMGKHKEECLDCNPKCKFRVKDKCRLYNCSECGNFMEEGEPAIRVVFPATQIMEKRRRFLYGRGIGRKPKEVEAFVNFHVNCYRIQQDRWIATKLGVRNA